MKRTRDVMALTLVAAVTGALVLVVGSRLRGFDPAGALAGSLGLGSGPVLGAIVGGLLGAWLGLGGPKRIAQTAGAMVAIGFLLGAWRLTRPSLWILDVVLRETLGEGGEVYSGLVLFLIAFPVVRAVAGVVAAAVAGLLRRRTSGTAPTG